MQFPESWLREFCNPPIDTSHLAETLTMAGLEVEDVRPAAPAFNHVVVGHILEVVQHPNADRLRVCVVDVGPANKNSDGQHQPLTIVCGAPNARRGIKVPCAMVGAELPSGDDGAKLLIKLGKLRGVESQGMLCSARELRLAHDHDGLFELESTAIPGQSLREHLSLDDNLLTLKLTPNLAHCLSVMGVARELSALTGSPLVVPAFPKIEANISDVLPVKVSATDLCGRFSGRIIRNIDAKAQTPSWMVERLARCGQRSVSALVDISNYVMFELGRPSHIFDLDKIQGGLDVRWANAGEEIELLNGSTVTLDERVGVIADGVQVESLAGIMGGAATAVSDETRNVYLEAAFWWPKAVAGRSRRFNFSTDAGHRFERGVDPESTVEHIERISQLILSICGTPATVCGPVDDQQPNMPVKSSVQVRVARASKIIGMPLTHAECKAALSRLGLKVEDHTEGVLTVTPPSSRFDLQIEEDLIEEIARMVGYDNLPDTPPEAPITAKLRTELQRSPFAVRRAMAALGYQETINFSFVDERWEHQLAGNPEPIRLLNPIASQMSVLRSSLMASLIQVLKFNLDRKCSRVRIFEIGSVFLRDPSVKGTDTTVEGFNQPLRLAGLVSGPAEILHWATKGQPADFYDVKGDVEALLWPLVPNFEFTEHPALHPGRSAKIFVNGTLVGVIGEIHPKWRQVYELSTAAVLFEIELDAVLARDLPVFTPVSKTQAVERDIAVLVDEHVSHAELMRVIWATPTGGMLKNATLFDVYRPKSASGEKQAVLGTKSLAVKLSLNNDNANITEEQIDGAVEAIVRELGEKVGARQRA